MTQRLRNDDRIAFPYGCSAETTIDRYCSDGSFDLYDFRSENERRRSDAASSLYAPETGAVGHGLDAGVSARGSRAASSARPTTRVGTGKRRRQRTLPADPTLTAENTNRSERSTELLRDAVQLNDRLTLWLALRHTALAPEREHRRLRGDRLQPIVQDTLAGRERPSTPTRCSTRAGVAAPSRTSCPIEPYVNAGQALPTMLSQQFEVGIKGTRDNAGWSVAAFDITRPVFADIEDTCNTDGTCTVQRQLDGNARHTGVEAGGSLHAGGWWLGGGLQWLKARRTGSQTAAINGQRPVNVPALSFKAQVRYTVPAMPSLVLGADLAAEGDRTMLPDDADLRLPAYATVGLNGQWLQRTGNSTLTWRAGIDNLFDHQGWEGSALPVRACVPIPSRPAAPPACRSRRGGSHVGNDDIICGYSPIAQSVERRTVNP